MSVAPIQCATRLDSVARPKAKTWFQAERATGESRPRHADAFQTPAPTAEAAHSASLSPDEVAGSLPSRPILTSTGRGWSGVELQRFAHPPGFIQVPAARDNILILNLTGPTLIEDFHGRQSTVKRWTDQDHISLLPAMAPLARELKGPCDVVLIHISEVLLKDVAREIFGEDDRLNRLKYLLAVRDESLSRLGRLLLEEAESDRASPGSALMADMLTRAIAVKLLRGYSRRTTAPPPAPLSMPPGRLERVLRHMRAHLDEPLRLFDLAELGGCSPSWFSRLFKQATGESPHKHLLRLRLSRARDLLEQTDLPIIQVGLECGFPQPAHFSTAFRKLTGMSPRVWRDARRGQGLAA